MISPELKAYKRRWYLANKSRIYAKYKLRLADPEFRDKQRLYQKERRQTHHASILKREREYVQKNRALINKRNAAYRLHNRDRQRLYFKKRHASLTPEQREKLRLKRKRYYDLNRQIFLDKVAEWRKNHPDNVRINQNKHLRKFAAKYNAVHQMRRVKMKDSTVDIENVQKFYEFVRTRIRIKCFYCSAWVSGADAHIDHVIPVSKGGKHCVSNLCASCPTCNLKKNAKLPSEFAGLLNL